MEARGLYPPPVGTVLKHPRHMPPRHEMGAIQRISCRIPAGCVSTPPCGVWVVSVSGMGSKPPSSTARMTCTSTQPLSLRMFSVLMTSPSGRVVWRSSGGSTVCKQLAPWKVGREKASGILFSPGKKGSKRKENTSTGYCIIYSRHFLE